MRLKMEYVTVRGEEIDLDEVASRLLGEKSKEDADLRTEGWRDGTLWAAKKATSAELTRLCAWYDQMCETDFWAAWLNNDGDAFGCGERLVFIIRPEDETREAANAFWSQVGGDDDLRYNSDYVEHFIEAAKNVWWKVRGRVCSSPAV